MMRAAATTAVVAGTAVAVSGSVARHQQGKAQQGADEPAVEQPPVAAEVPAAVPATPSTGLSPEAMEQLKGLAALKDQGVLTDEEFAAEKAKVLGS